MNVSLTARPAARPELTGLPLAVVSLGAAAIHFAVIPDHLAEWWAFGLFFAALGWFQALWAVAHLTRPSIRLDRLAILVNLATVALWTWSRTFGLPIGPAPGMPEAIGAPDVMATILELGLAVGLLVALRGRPLGAGSASGWPTLALAVGVASATTIAIAAGG
jgi:hypothetical protein